MSSGKRVAWLCLAPFLVIYGLLIFLPTAGVILKSFLSTKSLQFELLHLDQLRLSQFTLSNYIRLFNDSYYLVATYNTVLIAGVATIVSVVIGCLIAYYLACPGGDSRGLLRWTVSIPIYLPGVLASYALFLFLSTNGPVSFVADMVTGRSLSLVRTRFAVILGTMYIILPMFIRTAYAGFRTISYNLVEASYTLGGKEFFTFRKVVLPLALPSIVAGSLISFAYAMSLVVVVMILGSGGATFTTIPLEIMQETQGMQHNIPMAAAMSVLLLVISLVMQYAAERFLQGRLGGKEENG